MQIIDRQTARELFEHYRRQRDGIRNKPEMASICLICGSTHIIPKAGDAYKLVCRNCGFAFYRYACFDCGKTVDGRDPKNPGCEECGLRVCSCGACGCRGMNMQQKHKPDRYVSFVGIEGDRNSRELIAMLRRHIDDPLKSNRFWDLFKEKLDRIGQPSENGERCLDELFLIHSYINNIAELFEQYGDQAALALLEQIETESC